MLITAPGGVPQGSILGPLLFNIFINDLFFCVKNSEICNYADDNSLTVADADLDKIIAKLETDIDILNIWFKNNGMLLNEDKCHFMIIEPSWNTRKKVERITLRNETIEETNIAKLLGITFDNKLTTNDHIKIICKQASSKLYALARIARYLDEQKNKNLMKSFVISQFNYCPIVWMYCQRKSNNLINRIHERALLIAYNDYKSNFNQLLDKNNSVTIHHRNIQALATEIYKTLNNLNPIFMREIFSSKTHNYSIRTQNLNCPNPRTVAYGLESLGYKGSQIWKSIPKEIQECDDLHSFESFVSFK